MATPPSAPPASRLPLSAPRFWEPRRVLYNVILAVVVLIRIFANWTHFRPALTLGSLAAMTILALLANACYSVAYLAEIPIQQLFPRELWDRLRWAVWLLGTLFALVLENYWIADEIYPGASQGGTRPLREMNAMWTPYLTSNMNFPAPLAVLGFVGACAGVFVALASALFFWLARKPRLARRASCP